MAWYNDLGKLGQVRQIYNNTKAVSSFTVSYDAINKISNSNTHHNFIWEQKSQVNFHWQLPHYTSVTKKMLTTFLLFPHTAVVTSFIFGIRPHSYIIKTLYYRTSFVFRERYLDRKLFPTTTGMYDIIFMIKKKQKST